MGTRNTFLRETIAMSPLTVGLHPYLLNPQVESHASAGKVDERADIRLFVILAVIQVLDGLLTALGVMEFGTKAEGNVFVRQLMELVGTLPALTIIKSFSVLVIFSLAQLQHQVDWVTVAVRGVIVLYLITAIIPWTWILLKHLS